jgi:hypothetical protein
MSPTSPEGRLPESDPLDRCDRDSCLGDRLEEKSLGLHLLAIIEAREDHWRHGIPTLRLSHVQLHHSARAMAPQVKQHAALVATIIL